MLTFQVLTFSVTNHLYCNLDVCVRCINPFSLSCSVISLSIQTGKMAEKPRQVANKPYTEAQSYLPVFQQKNLKSIFRLAYSYAIYFSSYELNEYMPFLVSRQFQFCLFSHFPADILQFSTSAKILSGTLLFAPERNCFLFCALRQFES